MPVGVARSRSHAPLARPELRGLGYEGGFDAVRRYAHGWRREQVSSSAAALVVPALQTGDDYGMVGQVQHCSRAVDQQKLL